MIRTASQVDLEAMLGLAEMKRSQYAEYNPRFHRSSTNAREVQRPFLASQIEREDSIALVDDDRGTINGFIIASTRSAPPVYDIGGLTTGVDDFMVRDPSLWETVGRALLEEVRVRAREQGSVQLIVVCGPQDSLKRKMLRQADLTIASEWFTGAV
jgi:GNAT superfamily N-acetyltransferase